MNYQVTKNNGELEDFDKDKLRLSLIFSGASQAKADRIIKQIETSIKPNSSTKKIFKEAHRLLKRENRILASRYSLSKAINEMGPEGHIFEKFVCAIFQNLNYQASTNHVLQGRCISHEVDVVAKKQDHTIFCECKFHNRAGLKNDLKTALYIQARALDLKENPLNQLDEFWFVSNTKFTSDAITYAKCCGLKLLGPNFPKRKALVDLAQEAKTYPISSLSQLKKRHVRRLFKKEMTLVKEILSAPQSLKDIGLDEQEIGLVLNEARLLCEDL